MLSQGDEEVVEEWCRLEEMLEIREWKKVDEGGLGGLCENLGFARLVAR